MHEIDLIQFDLNLLTVLHVLLEERSVTGAAKRLHRTQPAVSHALARLREGLRDPILVRVGRRLEPTPRARRLSGEVARVLRHVSRILTEEGTFDAPTSERLFTISGPDFMAARLPRLHAMMAAQAPRATLEFLSPREGMLRDVAEGVIDLAIAPTLERVPEGLKQASLGAFDWAVFASRKHPGRRHWNLRMWARYPHIGIRTPSSTGSPVDAAVAASRMRRHVGLYLPHFLLAPPYLAQGPFLMTAPRVALEEVALRQGLLVLPCPLKLQPIQLSLYWSARLEREPASDWFRTLAWPSLCGPERKKGEGP